MRTEIRTNCRAWEADSDGYQLRNGRQLNRWDRLGWGVWDVGYGDWIRLFRSSGFEVENLIEIRPDVHRGKRDTTYEGYLDWEWACDYPGEHVWCLRKGGTPAAARP